MDNNKQGKVPSNFACGEGNLSSDYKLLFNKLKSIREVINLIEKNFLEKEI
tara:strand:- start:1442 stop:1594 length:153 start_codon:yes stop_codon:yes gene_type:complete